MKIPELLAPVGSTQHLKTAILSGASSIYLSGEDFGARKYAENFNLAEIREAVDYAHFYNVKVYVTVNTLIKERELEKVSEYLLELYKIGVDAVLVQDIGLIKIINENIPKLKIHASTQMNIHNIEGVKWAYKHNIKRIVLAREIELKELKEIIEYAHDLNMEVEIFAHGALCYSYSGHCLLSSFQGGRSGNRGTCAQPCREPYELNINQIKDINPKNEGNYLLSPKDLSLYENLGELVNLEVDCIKIEGRMRNNDYVATVIKNYRQRLNHLKHDRKTKILNENINKNKIKNTKQNKQKNKYKTKKLIKKIKEEEKLNNKKSLEQLELVFNREFTSGHLIPKNNPQIINRKKPGHNGLFIGTIHRYNRQTGELHILLKDDLLTIPQKGDGILIETSLNQIINQKKKLDKLSNKENDYLNKNNKNNKDRNNKNNGNNRNNRTNRNNKKINKNKSRKNKSDNTSNISPNISLNMENDKVHKLIKQNNTQKFYFYGFDISKKPILKDPKDKHWRKREKDKDVKQRVLVVKIVRENRKINIPLLTNSKVYLTKRNSLIKEINELNKNPKSQSFKKSKLELYFRIDSNNYPHLKGNLKLDNNKVITTSVTGEKWEKAIKKPITNQTIEKQLLKIGNLPYYIEKITINNDKNLFTPIGKLNELRRDFFNQLKEEVISSYKPKDKDLKIAEENILKLNKKLSKKIDLKTNAENKNNDYQLSVYINNLKILKEINDFNKSDFNKSTNIDNEKINNDVRNENNIRDIIYNKIYLEIPPNEYFEEIIEDNIKNNNPLESKELNISYCVNFLKKAIKLSQNQEYKLIWKLPDIAHKESKESIIKILGILKKMDLEIDVMCGLIGMDEVLNNKFGCEVYGNYTLNVFNIETILELNKFKQLSISHELYKKNIKNIMEDYYKIKRNVKNNNLPELELLVHGNIESMISRKEVISKKQFKVIQKYNKKQNKVKNNKKDKEKERYKINELNKNEFYIK